MAKAEPISRTIRYAVITATFNKSPVKIQDIYNAIESLSFNTGERYQDMSDGVRLAVIHEPSRNDGVIRGMIGDSRAKQLPVVENSGRIERLNLKHGCGLFDASHFAIFLNKQNLPIIAYEYNIRAPRINRLSSYVLMKFPYLIDYMSIEPINAKSIRQVLKGICNPMKYSLRAHVSCTLDKLDGNLSDAFNAMKKVSDCDYIELSFSRQKGRRTPINFVNLDSIEKFVSASENAALIESFKIKHKNDEGQDETVELLDLFLHDKISVPVMSDDSRFVDPKEIYERLDSFIKKRKKILDEVRK